MSLIRIQELVDTHGAPRYELADETEPDGNAFMMLATWRRAALDWGWPEAAVSEVCREATSGDYRHLRRVLARATGADRLVDNDIYGSPEGGRARTTAARHRFHRRDPR